MASCQVSWPGVTQDLPARASVAFLVSQWLGEIGGAGQWFLGLVQRDQVWDAKQKAALLDSLLKGYPIGAILLGRDELSPSGWVYDRDSAGQRFERLIAPPPWQILDGQQRISTLAAIFSSSPLGHAELDMTSEEPLVAWITPDQLRRAPIGPRSQRVDLSGWDKLMRTHSREYFQGLHAARLQDLLTNQLDAEFRVELTGQRGEIAVERWHHLLDLWFEERVPLLAAPVRSPEQLLEVFKRVNRAGTPIDEADIFYAAVKTFWPEAETSLQRIVCRTHTLVSRFAVLEFVTRLSRLALGAADPVGVKVEILNGAQGAVLRHVLTDMCAEDSVVMARVATMCTSLATDSRLGYALTAVHRRVLAAVLAWAAALPMDPDEHARFVESNRREVDAFLAGATVFDYRSAFKRDRFDRTSFREAVSAGTNGDRFPLARIVAVLREEAEAPELERVGSLENEASRRRLGDNHPSLVLGVVQNWSFGTALLDVDHIYASEASKTDMRVKGLTNRRVSHPDRSRLVNSLGNFWLIPQPTNASLGMDRPSKKFETLDRWLNPPIPGDERARYTVPTRANWAMEGHEPNGFKKVEKGLHPFKSNESTEAGVAALRTLVEQRGTRLVNQFLEQVPGCDSYSRDRFQVPMEPAPVDDRLAASVNLAKRRSEFEAAGAPLPGSSPVRGASVSWDGAWHGREDEVRRIWDEVSRRVKPDGHRMGNEQKASLANSRGLAYYRYVNLGFYFFFGALLVVDAETPSPLTLIREAGSSRKHRENDERLRSALLRTSFSEAVPLDPLGDIRISLPFDPGLNERLAVGTICEFLSDLRIALRVDAKT